MISGDFAFFQHGVDAIQHDAHCGRSHRFHGLANGGERGVYSAEAATSSKPITEQCSGTRTPALVKRADGAEGGHIVEGQQAP